MKRPFDPTLAATYPVAIGVDEVGRGALGSCVLVASVWFDPQAIPPPLLAALDDSKRLSAKRREALDLLIRQHCIFALAAASPRLIEKLNVRGATLDAMRRAVQKLAIPGHVYIDGKDVPPGLTQPAQSVIKGDQTIPQIAAASIIAKTLRDKLMLQLGALHPCYGWEQNAGYGTAQHILALRTHGPCAHHRSLFVRGILDNAQGTLEL